MFSFIFINCIFEHNKYFSEKNEKKKIKHFNQKRKQRSNIDEVSQKDIIHGLRSKKYRSAPPKKGSRYHSKVYKYIDLIYEGDTVVIGWYRCKICGYCLDITQNISGNKSLYNHLSGKHRHEYNKLMNVDESDDEKISRDSLAKYISKLKIKDDGFSKDDVVDKIYKKFKLDKRKKSTKC